MSLLVFPLYLLDTMLDRGDELLLHLSLPCILLCFRAGLAVYQIYLKTWYFQPNALTYHHFL